MSAEAAGRIRAFVNRWTAPDWLGRNDLQRIDEHELTVADLRAVLDEREQLAARVAELEAERAALAGYRLAADTEPDDELTRIWPTVNHMPCGAGVFGYDSMDADEIDLATLLHVVAEHRCAAGETAKEDGRG